MSGASPAFGYTLVYVSDVAATLAFWGDAFGCKTRFAHPSGEYGELATGATKLGFASHATAGSHGFPCTPLRPSDPPPGMEVGLVTDNVHDAFAKAVAAGATPVAEL